ncbi:MAG: DUF4397 domain-containing protein [Flavobacteriales bacterium]
MTPKPLLYAALAALITSCASKESVQVKFIHAAAGAGPVDVYFQDKLQAPGTASGRSAGYFTAEKKEKEPYYGEIRSGEVSLSAVTNPAWENGKRYTVVLFGNHNQLSKELFGDSYSMPSPGKANLRFMHFAPDMPEVDVYLDNKLLFDDVAYYGDNIFNGTRPFTEVNAGGTHTVEIRSTGSTVRSFTRSFNLQQGNTYTLFTRGNAAASGANAFAMELAMH